MNTLKVILIIVVALGVTACGASKSVDFSANPSINPLNYASGNLSYCNSISAPNLNGRIKAYTDQYGQLHNDTVDVVLDGTSIAQATSGGSVVKFYDWYVQTSGSTSINPTALSIVVKDYQTGQLLTGQWTELSQAMVDEYNRVHFLPSQSIADFMVGKTLVISGIQIQYQALRISIQNGSQELSSVDTLIPAFIANPNTYALNHAPILQALHPNNAIRSQGFTDAQYLQNLMSYCF